MDSIWTDRDDKDCRALLDAAKDGALLDGLLAIEGPTAAQGASSKAQIQAWGQEVSTLMARWGDARRLDALEQVLFHDAGLEGDRDAYHHPRNSHLTKVIERRRGLPILLAALWIEVARGAGLEAEGVGMPGHFIARIEGQLIDPFDRGRHLSETDCMQIVGRLTPKGMPWQDSFLDATPAHAILERVLRNLVGAWTRNDEPAPLYRAAHMLAALRPSPHHMLMHAGVSERIGAMRLALSIYKALMDRHPKSREAAVAIQRSGPLKIKARLLN